MSAETSAGNVSFDCTPWAGESRRILESLLNGREIPHAWEGTVVVVPAALADGVRDLTEEVAALADRALDPQEEQIAFEVSDWSGEAQNSIVAALDAAGISHEWDGDGDLVVAESSEAEVEKILLGVGEPDGDDEMDGIALNELLGDLFDAAGRLAKNPDDFRRRGEALDAIDQLAGVGTPFGYTDEHWNRILSAGANLAVSIDLPTANGEGDAASQADSDRTDSEDVEGSGSDDAVGREGEGDAGEPPSVQDSALVVRDLLKEVL